MQYKKVVLHLQKSMWPLANLIRPIFLVEKMPKNIHQENIHTSDLHACSALPYIIPPHIKVITCAFEKHPSPQALKFRVRLDSTDADNIS